MKKVYNCGKQEQNGKVSIISDVEILIQNNNIETCFIDPDEARFYNNTPDAYHYTVN
jgi:hypothetical protein